MPDFEEVYRLYFADVYRYILALSRDTAVAEEVTQETFFRALSTIGTFRGECQLRVWLCQIAKNTWLTLQEKRRRGSGPPEDHWPDPASLESRFTDKETALAIHREDIEMCRAISEYGLSLVKAGDGILTHCNAGQLATCRYGTATAPIYLGQERGYHFRVFADETRPLLQGARLTAYELYSAGVDVTLICDNMSAMVMEKGWVQAVFVGCDRVAANGDTANKIGTSVVAAVAKHYGVPFYVCAPTSTIDLATPTGAEIQIEQRPAEEVTEMWYRERMAPEGIKVFNPAFDVTDNGLVTAIVTENGIARAPFTESLAALKNLSGK